MSSKDEFNESKRKYFIQCIVAPKIIIQGQNVGFILGLYYYNLLYMYIVLLIN